MEDRTENPIAVRVEQHPQYVVLTYFQGDISSMVDAHFTRALGKECKTKASAARAKKIHKTIKLGKRTNQHALPDYNLTSLVRLIAWFLSLTAAEDASPCQSSAGNSYRDSQMPPPPGHLLSFSSVDNSSSWHSLNPRTGESPALPSIAYPLPPDGLSLTGQQYATSLLNLLHSDRGEMGPSMPSNMPSSSKPELVPNWSPAFREPTDSLNAVGFEQGNLQLLCKNIMNQ